MPKHEETQVCEECKLPKPLSMFAKCITAANGHARICKKCQPEVSHRHRQKKFIQKYGFLAYMEWVQTRQDMVNRLINYAEEIHAARVRTDESKCSTHKAKAMAEQCALLATFGSYDEQIKHLQPKLPLTGVAQLLGVTLKQATDIVRISGYKTSEGAWGEASKKIPRKKTWTIRWSKPSST